MVGENEINLCASEMHMALQHYFNTVLFRQSPGEVTGVKEIDNITGKIFVVTIKETS